MIPPELFNTLAHMCGLSDRFSDDNEIVNVSDTHKRKILSIAQDILYLAHKGRIITPKHYALAMSVRHWTGQSTLVSVLNGLRHSASFSKVSKLDTALAEQQQQKGITPDGIQTETFTQLAWDNNDFREETLSGKGTTHNTNGIIVQKLSSLHGQQTVQNRSSLPKNKKRTVAYAHEPHPEYHNKKKVFHL